MELAATLNAGRVKLGAAFAVLAVLVTGLPAGSHSSQKPTAGVVVQALPGELHAAADAVRTAGGTVGRQLGIIDGFAARVPAAALDGLQSATGIRAVTPDRALHLLHAVDGFDGSTDAGSMYHTAWSMGARAAYSAGLTGQGVDVALVDSGIAPVTGLSAAGKVVNAPDLSFDSQSDSTRYLDAYGHGTHLAGIIAGRDPAAPADAKLPQDHDDFAGIAPSARLVNVKVADATGATDVSQVIAAIDWIVQHRHDNGLNIRVLNLSFGTTSTQDYRTDPLTYAAEVAWRHGIVVVAAAGNQGTTLGRLSDPASDPYVIAVGADNAGGTPAVSDDTVPDFSSRGDGARNPDLVAPGKSLVSLRVPGSWVDQNHPEGLVNTRFFRGSGTSQAAAAVSGAVADIIQQRPLITPDQLKALLTTTATSLPGVSPATQGSGLINVGAALQTATPTAVQSWPLATGTGSLEESRGGAHLARDGVSLTGEEDIFGQAFDAADMAASEQNEASWSGGAWNGSTWSGSSWSGSSWSGSSWSGSSWSGSSWSGSSWSGSSWSGSSWSGSSWSGSSWSGSSWSGSSWSGGSWSDPQQTTTACSGRTCAHDQGANTTWGS